jgi:septal ring factor EnvC (AmiA/AmiB activator)
MDRNSSKNGGGRDLLPTHRPLPRREPHPRGDRAPGRREQGDRAALAEQRASLAKEIARAERAIERYQDAFENGNLNPACFKQRLSALDARLDALNEQDQTLASELAAEAPTTPDSSALRAVPDELGRTIAHGDPDQAEALLRILTAELRGNSRRENPAHLPAQRAQIRVPAEPISLG